MGVVVRRNRYTGGRSSYYDDDSRKLHVSYGEEAIALSCQSDIGILLGPSHHEDPGQLISGLAPIRQRAGDVISTLFDELLETSSNVGGNQYLCY
ncbi:hypothetical protein Tco_1210687 [Tanacetum coccineum]